MNRLRQLFKGEPVRVLAYGAAVFIGLYLLVTKQISSDDLGTGLTLVAGVLGVTETARRQVYSPATVERVVEEALYTPVPGTPEADIPPVTAEEIIEADDPTAAYEEFEEDGPDPYDPEDPASQYS